MDLRRILVPLDGSDLAEQALPLAEQLAQLAGSELTLARAPLARVFAGMDAIDADEAEASATSEAEAYLHAQRERLVRQGIRCQIATPVPVHEDHGVGVGQVVRASLPFRQLAAVYREVAEAITREAEARGVDLIMMASHGRSGLRRWVYGSVAMDLLRQASIPLLLVRSGASGRLPEGSSLRILVPLDGSAFGESALDASVLLARLLGGSLVLIQVIAEGHRSGLGLLLGPLGDDVTEHAALRAAAESYLEDVSNALSARGVAADIQVAAGDPTQEILNGMRDRGCALVAVATHGRSGLARLGTGSVAEAVMTRAPAPVLVVHSADRNDEQRIAPLADNEAANAPSPSPIMAAPSVPVRLSGAELEILGTALRMLRQTADRHEHLAEPIQQLLDKLEVAGGELPPEPTTSP